MKYIGNYARTLTDERMIVDFAIPGVNVEAIEVTVRPNKFEDPDNPSRSFGRDIVVKVNDEKLVVTDGFGLNGGICGSKDVIKVPADFDIAKVVWTYKDGMLRISVPKIEEWKGVAVVATAPAAVTAPNA